MDQRSTRVYERVLPLAVHALWICLVAQGTLHAPLAGQTDDPLFYTDPTYAWEDNRDPEAVRASPSAVAGLQIGYTRVWIAYGRPGVKNRPILGELVPYDQTWRTGSDEAPTLTLTGPIDVEGRRLAAGTYALFTIPGEDRWTIILSNKHNHWGESYDASADEMRFTVRSEPSSFVERMQFTFDEIDTDAYTAVLSLRWERVRVPIRFTEP